MHQNYPRDDDNENARGNGNDIYDRSAGVAFDHNADDDDSRNQTRYHVARLDSRHGQQGDPKRQEGEVKVSVLVNAVLDEAQAVCAPLVHITGMVELVQFITPMWLLFRWVLKLFGLDLKITL